jgi:hypothetical protein
LPVFVALRADHPAGEQPEHTDDNNEPSEHAKVVTGVEDKGECQAQEDDADARYEMDHG